jgi:hypothetical protein
MNPPELPDKTGNLLAEKDQRQYKYEQVRKSHQE